MKQFTLVCLMLWASVMGVSAQVSEPLATREAGEYEVKIGKITGKDGKPILEGKIGDVSFTDGEYPTFYKYSGIYWLSVEVPGYFPIGLDCLVSDEDVTLDIDFSEARAVTVYVKDRDGSPLPDADVKPGIGYTSYDDLSVKTDKEGKCVLYGMPGETSYSVLVESEKPFYSSLWGEKFIISDSDLTQTVSYEDYFLVQFRYKNVKKYGSYSYVLGGSTIKWYRSDEDDQPDEFSLGYFIEDGDDILMGCMQRKYKYTDEPYTYAELNHEFCLRTEDYQRRYIYPFVKENIPLDGKDLLFEYDLDEFSMVTFKEPEGFDFVGYKINGLEIEPGATLLPKGEHTWAVRLRNEESSTTYPYSKEQQLTVTEKEMEVPTVFNENDFCGVRFLVKDENGRPAEGFGVNLYEGTETDDYNTSYQSGSTDANGRCTLYVSEPMTCAYTIGANPEDGNSYYPITKQIEIGETLKEEVVSYEDYQMLTVTLSNYEMPEYSLPVVVLNDNAQNKDAYLILRKKTDASVSTYEGSILLPEQTFEVSCDVSRDGCAGQIEFTADMKGKSVKKEFDINTYHTVKYSLNGVPADEGYFSPNGRDGFNLYVEGNTTDFLKYKFLPQGKYVATYAHETLAFRDTIHFELKDKDVVFDYPVNPEEYHRLILKTRNAVCEVAGLSILIDGTFDYSSSYSRYLYKNGKHQYVITEVHPVYGDGSSLFKTWPLSGDFEINNENAVVDVDLSAFRYVSVKYTLPAGVWRDGDEYVSFIGKEGTFTDVVYSRYALPVGTYKVILLDAYNTEKETKYYGTLTVTDEVRQEVTINFTKDDVTAIKGIDASVEVLSATVNGGYVTVTAPKNETVCVRFYNSVGVLLWSDEMMPGEKRLLPALPKGVYLIGLEQGETRTTLRQMR